eukprot:9891693-Ditylum_brightwellii.AAC.1
MRMLSTSPMIHMDYLSSHSWKDSYLPLRWARLEQQRLDKRIIMRGNKYSGQKELSQAHQFSLLVYMTRQKKLSFFRVVQMQLYDVIKLRSLERCRAGWLQDSAV